MDRIIINGGQPLSGTISISGSKNACLPIMAASILTDQNINLSNVPNLEDIKTMSKVLTSLDVEVDTSKANENKITLKYLNTGKSIAEYDLVRKMRASILVLGPLLARKRHASVSLPGGCAIGARPVDLHLNALAKLGAEFKLDRGYIECSAPKGLKGEEITFPTISVGATESLLMAATLAEGRTKLNNIAIEPEVIDLIHCLQSMGAKIEITDQRTVIIEGVKELFGTSHNIISDRIETLTYVIAGALTGENLKIENIQLEHVSNVLEIFKSLNIDFSFNNSSLNINKTKIFQGIELETREYPGFPTDMQAQLMVLLSKANSGSVITENIFENRYMHVPELNRMGANISVEGKKAIIKPSEKLIGAEVMATDLRASVSLILAGLIAEGETVVNRVYHLDRGYEQVESKLKNVGAVIKRV